MGILDEAIREHLDLKRRKGAADDELKRLEDEAFGPPARPGEPDFPGSEPGEQPSGATEAAPTGEQATSDGPAAHAADTATAPPPESPAAEPEPEPEQSVELEVAEPEPNESPAASVEPEAPADDASAHAADTATGAPSPPAAVVEPEATAEAPPEPAAEPVPEPAAETGETPAFYDQSEDDLELDLELEVDDEPEALEPPIESLDTVEHQIEDTGESESVAEPVTGEDDEVEYVEGELEDDEDEDVLEETPEFLRDAPEDDELWFEQGKPKDFDF